VVFLDEIDALHDDALLSILRQLRDGYSVRPKGFPWSLGLIGMRDVRDYKVTSSGNSHLQTSSPFNIKAASLTLAGFSPADVATLYAQHTAETRQRFESAAIDRAFFLTQGQPWLVNALAKENLIRRQDTHLDSLAERLREPRVRAVMEPILAGLQLPDVPEDDRRYVTDLGLVRPRDGGGLDVANPMYREVIPRSLAQGVQDSLPRIAPTWLRPDGRLGSAQRLEAFVVFWRQHGEPLFQTAHYHELAPHLVLMAFLHRVVNGGGILKREYAIGSGRMDLLVT